MTSLSDLLTEELAYWEKLVADNDNSYVVHGGKSEVLFLIDMQKEVNRQFLLDRYKEVRDRKLQCATYDLAVTTKERDEKRMEAIKRIGEKIKTIS